MGYFVQWQQVQKSMSVAMTANVCVCAVAENACAATVVRVSVLQRHMEKCTSAQRWKIQKLALVQWRQVHIGAVALSEVLSISALAVSGMLWDGAVAWWHSTTCRCYCSGWVIA